ncbi:inositol hexakisphosphate-domain-containing protein [Cladochytrium replicatum]|nr:inositol hexakisphosphate-domain-containing protein [Cladochytrium replicatum]
MLLSWKFDPIELLKSVNSVVKNRAGSVLARQSILKSDHFETGPNHNIGFYLQGAPNFRGADLNIYGVAQPTVAGISTILTLLQCNTSGEDPPTCVWFSAREEPILYINGIPFVLREHERPLQNVKTYQGISAGRLERMEERLKDDALKEADQCGGLLLVHDELEPGKVVPTWTAVDSIQTPREVFDGFRATGFRVVYVRFPISAEQAPEDRYLDDYVEIISSVKNSDPLVFNCGMGMGRTTFAMVAATLIRRAKIYSETTQGLSTAVGGGKVFERPGLVGGSQADMRSIAESELQNRALLRCIYILEKALSSQVRPRSAVDWALARGQMIDDLKNAVLGNYLVVLQLVSVLSEGRSCKRLLDEVIDQCEVMMNIREVILLHRVRYSQSGDTSYLERAKGSLERYFFLLVFAGFLQERLKEGMQFSEWVSNRPEIGRMLDSFRKEGSRLFLFRPVEDLSILAESESIGTVAWGTRQTGKPLGNELEKHVMKMRQGKVLVQNSLLKIDHWQMGSEEGLIKGAPNFRSAGTLKVYGVAQPTIQGIKSVIKLLRSQDNQSMNQIDGTCSNFINKPMPDIVWINLREEPIIYINGMPYVLRDQYCTLRNLRSYSGITPARLEMIEKRLKDDVIAELTKYEGQILLHGEVEGGKLIANWEDCKSSNIHTIREVFEVVKNELDGETIPTAANQGRIMYYRSPVTAERPPDESDFDYLVQILTSVNVKQASIVLNCQMGMGRSTTGTVIVALIIHWLTKTKPEHEASKQARLNYQLIHSLQRVIRNGLECKEIVDNVIDSCDMLVNLRVAIEECHLAAESAEDTKRAIRRGKMYLKRYFLLIAFQAYLDAHPIDNVADFGSLQTFSNWMNTHEEFSSMLDEFFMPENISTLTPVERLAPGDGIALTSEVLDVVNKRQGAVLAQQTILKYDMFPGCQKMSLSERIEGAPNFRKIQFSSVESSLFSHPRATQPNLHSLVASPDSYAAGSSVFGVAMPTKDGIRRVLQKVGAGPDGSRTLLWTSLREEPVIYVNGRPFVLRLFQEPIKNVEATGIARERVERMETRMKSDIIAEMKQFNGRLLLHEEEAENGQFRIVPVWETVREEDIQTPQEVFRSIEAEGFRVNYLRIPVTDEQTPIPDVFNQLVDRLLNINNQTDVLFNCQMGRGRTTSGTVIACLSQLIIGNHKLVSSLEGVIEQEDEDLAIYPPTDSHKSHTLSDEKDLERMRYTNGEYKVILQLIAVLQYGKVAKRLTDRAIDFCDHMQNLRVAIYDFKLRVEALQPGTKKHTEMLDTALNYLVRYFYLITFAAYLLEEMTGAEWEYENTISLDGDNSELKKSDMAERSSSQSWPQGTANFKHMARVTFSQWLKERREISNILRKSNQSLD